MKPFLTGIQWFGRRDARVGVGWSGWPATLKQTGGVRSDRVVWLGGPQSGVGLRQALRIVEVHASDEHGKPIVLLLATNRLDLDAELIALGYRFRWAIELLDRKRLYFNQEGFHGCQAARSGN